MKKLVLVIVLITVFTCKEVNETKDLEQTEAAVKEIFSIDLSYRENSIQITP